MADNAQNDDFDFHNEAALAVDEAIKIFVKGVIDILEKEIMNPFVQET